MITNNRLKTVFVLILLAPFWTTLFAQQTGELVTIDKPVAEDLYIAGKSVHVLSEVDGDLVTAGQRIEIKQNVTGDVIAAGERLSIRGSIGDDIRAAGRILNVYGQVVGDAILAGETIEIAPDSTVGGRLWSAGRSVEIHGRAERELRVAAQHVSISGTVGGDVYLIAQKIELLPGAQINGNLTYRSDNEILIAPGAEVIGTIERKDLETPTAQDGGAFLFIIGFFLSLIISVSVIYWLFSRMTKESSEIVLRDPFKSLGIGLAVFFIVPVLAVTLLATVLGIPLGFLLLALYPVLLFLGFAIGLYSLATIVLRLVKRGDNATRVWRLAGVAAALLLLTLAQFIPFVGGFISLFVVLAGLGAVAMWMFQRSRSV